MSKVKPCSFNWQARPPGVLFFSSTVTFQPSLAMKDAADRPANPLPIIMTDFSDKGDVLITTDLFLQQFTGKVNTALDRT